VLELDVAPPAELAELLAVAACSCPLEHAAMAIAAASAALMRKGVATARRGRAPIGLSLWPAWDAIRV
jgi:hypothetical protein